MLRSHTFLYIFTNLCISLYGIKIYLKGANILILHLIYGPDNIMTKSINDNGKIANISIDKAKLTSRDANAPAENEKKTNVIRTKIPS